MASLQQLLEQRSVLDRQIEAAKRAQHADAIATIRRLMAENGLTVADLDSPSGGSKRSIRSTSSLTGKKVQAKYRHPVTGESWTGRGLKPKWLNAELSSGKSISDFAI